jgi:hypothetical protein
MKAASLSSSLLARKGAASPAELSLVQVEGRRQAAKPANRQPQPQPQPQPQTHGCAHKAEIAAVKAAGADAQSGPYTAKFTLRLDRERHLRLKLLAAHLHLSAQEMLIEALDAYLDQAVPQAIRNNCSCLAQLEDETR